MPRTRTPRSLALAGLAIAFAGEALAQQNERVDPEAVGMSSVRLERIRDMLQEEVEARHIGSAVALVARDGKVVFLEAVGEAAVGEPMFDDAIMRLASVGKAFTATAAMILYERGLLALDDPVADYIPAYAEVRVTQVDSTGSTRLVDPHRSVTVRDLLTHRGGLSVASDAFEEAWTATEAKTTTLDLAERIARIPMPAHPGQSYDYGYYGSHYEVLAAVIEAASGQTLETLFDEHLFGPLGMGDAHFWVPPEKVDRLPAIYQMQAGELSIHRGRGEETPRSTFLSGGGGVRATVRDVFRYGQMMLEGGALDGVRILSPKTVDLMMTDHVGDLMTWRRGEYGWGFGFSVRRRVRDHEIGSPGTIGWGGGSGALWWADPVEDLVAVVVTPYRPPPHWEVFRKFERLVYAAVTRSRGPETSEVEDREMERAPGDSPFPAARRQAIEAVRDSGVPAVAVVVSEAGSLRWAEAFGWLDEAKSVPVSVSHPLPLASITKVFTAVALMQLVSEGAVRLDDPVRHHLPPALARALPADVGSVSLARLARHTAGLPAYYRNIYTSLEEPLIAPDTVLVRYAFLAQPPGTRYRYSNLGYLLLQRVIEHRSRLSFEAYVRTRIAAPLGLASVYEKRAGDPFPAAIAGRDRLDRPTPFYLNDTPGASSLYASAEDLVRFGRAAITPGELLDAEALAEMYRPDPEGLSPHGIGWYVDGPAGGVYHGGWMAGASTGLFIEPDLDLVTAVLSTASPSWPYMVPDSIHRAVLHAVAPEQTATRAEPGSAPGGGGAEAPSGAWEGRVRTWAGDFPLALAISDGAACVAFDGAEPEELAGYSVSPSTVQGRFPGTLRTPDALVDVPHVLLLDLVRHGETLRGEMMAWTPGSPERFGLSAYVELERAPASTASCGAADPAS